MVGLLAPSSCGGVQFEGPQHVGNIFEAGTDGDEFVDHILDADDSVTSQSLFDEVVGGDGGPLSVNLKESTLVDQFAN